MKSYWSRIKSDLLLLYKALNCFPLFVKNEIINLLKKYDFTGVIHPYLRSSVPVE